MEIESIKIALKQLVANGQNEQALEQLLELSYTQPSEVSDQIYSLSSAYRKHKKDVSFGMLSDEQERQFSNELTRRLLATINVLEDHPEAVATDPGKESTTGREWPDGEEKEKDAVVGPERENVRDVTTQQAPKTKKSGKRIALWLIGGFLLLLPAVYWIGTQEGFFRNQEPFSEKVWVGTWRQTIEGTLDLVVTGDLIFEIEDGQLTGTSHNLHYGGVGRKSDLFHITLDEKNRTIKGLWKSREDEDQAGRFEFYFKDPSTFEGHYTLDPDPDSRFFWNGTR